MLIAGLGTRESFGPEQARVAAAAAAGRAKELGAVSLSWAAPEGDGVAAALVEGTLMKLYSFDRFKSAQSGDDLAGGIESLEVSGESVDGHEVERGRIAGAAANAARDLQNLPANVATPTFLAERAREIAVQIVQLSQYDRDLMLLACELAMGVAPANVRDTSDCCDRYDAAHQFVSEIFHNTAAFDERVRAYIREVADSAQGGTQ